MVRQVDVMGSPYYYGATPLGYLPGAGLPAAGSSPKPSEKPHQEGVLQTVDTLTAGIFTPIAIGASHSSNMLDKATGGGWRQIKRDLAARAGQKVLDARLLPETTGILNGNTSPYLTAATQATRNIDWRTLDTKFNQHAIGGLFGFGLKSVNYSDLTKANWWNTVKGNFSNVRLIPQIGDGSTRLTLGNYLKYGITGNHFRYVGKYLSEGTGLAKAALNSVNIGFALTRSVLTVKEAWNRSRDKGDGLLTSIFKAAKAGIKDLSYFLVGYEIGSIAYCAAAGLTAVGGLAPIVGLFAAGFVGTLAGSTLKKVFGNPIEDDPPANPEDKHDPGSPNPFQYMVPR